MSNSSITSPGVHPQLEASILADPLDFSSWTALLSHVEQHANSLHPVKTVFDWFLSFYPLCWGYWCKYADILDRISSNDDHCNPSSDSSKFPNPSVLEIYERAVSHGAARFSVDIWQSYCQYMVAHCDDGDDVRQIFENAVDAVGSHPYSGPLWSAFVAYEKEEGTHWESIYDIYKRALSQYLISIPQLIEDMCSMLHNETSDELESKMVEGASIASISLKQVNRRTPIESQLIRQFFHVKPLDSIQLSAWRALLDFEESESSSATHTSRMICTYERCILVCANYSEFWNRYVLWTVDNIGISQAIEIAQRACTVLRFRPDMHLLCAELLESDKQYNSARKMYEHVLTYLAPGLLEAIMKLIAFEKRRGDVQAVLSVYQYAIHPPPPILAPSDAILTFLYLHMAKYLSTFVKDFHKSRDAYRQGSCVVPSSLEIWFSWMDMEACDPTEGRHKRVRDVFIKANIAQCKAEICIAEDGEVAMDSCITPAVSIEDRISIWEKFIEINDDLCTNIREQLFIRSAYKNWLAFMFEQDESVRDKTMTEIIQNMSKRFSRGMIGSVVTNVSNQRAEVDSDDSTFRESTKRLLEYDSLEEGEITPPNKHAKNEESKSNHSDNIFESSSTSMSPNDRNAGQSEVGTHPPSSLLVGYSSSEDKPSNSKEYRVKSNGNEDDKEASSANSGNESYILEVKNDEEDMDILELERLAAEFNNNKSLHTETKKYCFSEVQSTSTAVDVNFETENGEDLPLRNS